MQGVRLRADDKAWQRRDIEGFVSVHCCGWVSLLDGVGADKRLRAVFEAERDGRAHAIQSGGEFDHGY